MQLTETQQQLLLEAKWVINTVLVQLGERGNSDYKQIAFLYLCSCVKRFNPNKGVKWTSYAYSSVYWKLKKQQASDKRKAENQVSLTNIYSLSSPQQSSQSEAVFELNRIKEVLNERERFFIDQLLKGYTLTEIGKMINLSHTSASKVWHSIKEKASQFKNDPPT